MTGHFSAFSKTAARFAFAGAIFAVSVVSTSDALAQDPPIPPVPATIRPDSVPAPSADTIIPAPLELGDTAKEVTHTVKKGDTLWDLAQYYLRDPFRWPEIFRRNTDVVENPHWIFPGELIRIWGDFVRPDAFARADSAGNVVSSIVTSPVPPVATQGGAGPELTVFASPLSRAAAEMGAQSIMRSGTSGVRRGEVDAAPYVERRGGPPGAGRLIASVDRLGIQSTSPEVRFQLNDRLYVEMPRGLVARVGDRYVTYTLGNELPGVGQIVVPTGIVRVETVASGQPPQVRILRQFGEIRLQQRMIAFSDAILPTASTSPLAGGPSGKVLYVHNQSVLPSIGHYVVVSPNARSGVQVGDEFSFIEVMVGRSEDIAAPPVSAGTAQVVRVTPYATTAIIVSQVQPTIREGMPVRLTGKMR